ncbi:MAG: fibronectin type III domain-containing protein [Burkholderiaceae bacterium]|nr:fibronectin type III domain-containing protein [Burkholderiaceae bacterium]
MAVDSNGHVYIVDNNRIFEINASGIITTVAGIGSLGYSGDNGPANSAELNSPAALALDGAGNIYIADFGNHRVRQVLAYATPDAPTIGFAAAGNGTVTLNWTTPSSSGSFPISGYNVQISTTAGGAYTDVSAGTCTAANTSTATSCTVNGLHNGTTYYFKVAAINFEGSGAASAASNSATCFTTPAQASATLTASNDSANIAFTTPADDGSMLEGYVVYVGAATITINGTGVGSSSTAGGYTAAVSSVSGGVTIITVAGLTNGTSYSVGVAAFNAAGDAVESPVSSVTPLARPGLITTVAGNGMAGNNGQASSAVLSEPRGVAVDGSGNLYFADSGNNVVRMVSTSGTITTVAGIGAPGYFGDGGVATSAMLKGPEGVAIDAVGSLYIADTGNGVIRKVSAAGIITTVATSGLPVGVAVDAAGNVYFSDAHSHVVRKLNTSNMITTVAGNGTAGYSGDGSAATSAELNNPTGLAFDAAGDLYIADTSNNRIRKISANGTITTIAGNGIAGYTGDAGAATTAELSAPVCVTVDTTGNLFISDSGNNVIRKVNASGTISTAAGNGTPGYGGDNASATNAELKSPSGMALDSAGNLYIGDTGNNRIRQVALVNSATPASFSAAASGSDAALTLTATIKPASGDQGTLSNLYVAAVLPNGTLYVLSSAGWLPYTGTVYPAVNNTMLAASDSVLVIGAMNVTDLIDTVVFAGYGTSEADLLGSRKFGAIYTIH